MFDFFFFKQKTAYEMRISDWSSDVCSSDLLGRQHDRDDLRIDAFAALDVADAGAVEHVLDTVLDDLAQLGRNRRDVSTRLADKHRVFRPHAFRVEMILIVQRGRQRLDRSISKSTLESKLSEQTMKPKTLFVTGIAEDRKNACEGKSV